MKEGYVHVALRRHTNLLAMSVREPMPETIGLPGGECKFLHFRECVKDRDTRKFGNQEV